MLLATDPALTKTIGLVIVFGGIGVVVNAIIGYIAFQVRGEREQNRRNASAALREPPA